MKPKKRILLLGPAHPYRGGIADTQNEFAKSLQENGHKVILFTFKFQYPKFLFPGKTQLTNNPAPLELNIKRKIHSGLQQTRPCSCDFPGSYRRYS